MIPDDVCFGGKESIFEKRAGLSAETLEPNMAPNRWIFNKFRLNLLENAIAVGEHKNG